MRWASSGATGLEPAISGVTGQRDKPASLRPRNVGYTILLWRKSQEALYKKNAYSVKNLLSEPEPMSIISLLPINNPDASVGVLNPPHE